VGSRSVHQHKVVVFDDENEITAYDNRRLDAALEAGVNLLSCDVMNAAAKCTRRHSFVFNSTDAGSRPVVWLCQCYSVNYGSATNIECAQTADFPLRGQLQRPQPQVPAERRHRIDRLMSHRTPGTFQNFYDSFRLGDQPLFVGVTDCGTYLRVYDTEVLNS
jgi:hypothetical protein